MKVGPSRISVACARDLDRLGLMSEKPTTLRELARRLGMGKSTVQRALAGSPRVAKRTRERVERMAAELGFKRSLYFSTLSAQRRVAGGQRVLVHYVKEFIPQATGDPTGTGFDAFESLRQEQAAIGIEVCRVEQDLFKEPERLPGILYARGCCGFLVGHCRPEVYEALAAFGRLPLLSCYRNEAFSCCTIAYNVAEFVRLCWRKLWEKGYRRIGFALLKHHPPLWEDRLRLAALADLREQYGEVVDAIPPLRADIRSIEPYLEWLRTHRPEAVIGFRSGHVCYQREAGFGHIPFVALHAKDSPDPEIQQLPGSHQPAALLARETLRRMDDMIRHGEVGMPDHPVEVLIPPVWREGKGIPRR